MGMGVMEPFSTMLDMGTGALQPAGRVMRRRLSDMRGMYADREAVSRVLDEEGDRLIYEVQAADLPEREGLVLYSTTIIYPGRIGAEYHMTKGHFHEKRDRSEIYVGLAGEGVLVLQTEDGTVRGVKMQPGTIAYVPSMWAHRTVNVGEDAFSFLAAWPGDAGHDYGTIEETGFSKLLVDQGGKPTFIDNPRWAK
jgi:glucose-6-phosphate isomerase